MFPKDSAFKQQENIEAQRHALPPRPIATHESALIKTASIPVRDLEDLAAAVRQVGWANDIEDEFVNAQLESIADRLASYLPG